MTPAHLENHYAAITRNEGLAASLRARLANGEKLTEEQMGFLNDTNLPPAQPFDQVMRILELVVNPEKSKARLAELKSATDENWLASSTAAKAKGEAAAEQQKNERDLEKARAAHDAQVAALATERDTHERVIAARAAALDTKEKALVAREAAAER